jgi:hypothetical protein
MLNAWWISLVWYSGCLVHLDAMRNWCRQQCAHDEAQHVWVWQRANEDEDVAMTQRGLWVERVRRGVAAVAAACSRLQRAHGHHQTLPVQVETLPYRYPIVTLSIPVQVEMLHYRYPIDTLSVLYRYTIVTLLVLYRYTIVTLSIP